MCSPVSDGIKFIATYSCSPFSPSSATLQITLCSEPLEPVATHVPSEAGDKQPLVFKSSSTDQKSRFDVIVTTVAIANKMQFFSHYQEAKDFICMGKGKTAIQYVTYKQPVILLIKPIFEAGKCYTIHFSKIENPHYKATQTLDKTEPVISAIIEQTIPSSDLCAKVTRGAIIEQDKEFLQNLPYDIGKLSSKDRELLSTDQLQIKYELFFKATYVIAKLLKEIRTECRDDALDIFDLIQKAQNLITINTDLYALCLEKRGVVLNPPKSSFLLF